MNSGPLDSHQRNEVALSFFAEKAHRLSETAPAACAQLPEEDRDPEGGSLREEARGSHPERGQTLTWLMGGRAVFSEHVFQSRRRTAKTSHTSDHSPHLMTHLGTNDAARPSDSTGQG